MWRWPSVTPRQRLDVQVLQRRGLCAREAADLLLRERDVAAQLGLERIGGAGGLRGRHDEAARRPAVELGE